MKLNVCTLLLVLATVQSTVAIKDMLCKACPVVCQLIGHEQIQKVCSMICTTVCNPTRFDLIEVARSTGSHAVPMPLSWDAYDLNEDDAISPQELAAATSVNVNDPGFQWAFQTADKNGDGMLSKKEFYSGPFVFESDLDEAEYERCKSILGRQEE